MIELQDDAGHLIVVIPMRVRHSARMVYVFVDGVKIAEFTSIGEAARYARLLAQGGYTEQSGPPPVSEGSVV
jgi:hypothetical protein